MSRVRVNGPSPGPVHTTLWSSGRRRGPVPWKGWLLLYFGGVGGITWAFAVALVLGILASAGFAVIAALAVYGAVAAWRQTRRRTAGAPAPASFQAVHVPASAAYKKAHPEGPRDWEPAS